MEAMDKVKNGGIVAFVTSAGTLDKRDENVRQMLADKADLIGAIRLPGGKNGAFKDNAGTEVTTDIIFLQKREGKSVAEMSDIPDWVHIGEMADGLPINKYFEQHPDMVLGTVVEGNKLYGSGTMVVAEDGFDPKTALHEAVGKLPAEISHERGRDPSGHVPTAEKLNKHIAELKKQSAQKNARYKAVKLKADELSQAANEIEQYLRQEQSRDRQKKKNRSVLE